jgi:hypothetical protein
MKYTISLIICLGLLTACLTEEEKRLQTDQTFEGEEMFNLSYSLDEHVAYAFQQLEFYRDTANQAALVGCPTVAINDVTREVTLTFGEGECPSNKALRTGKLIISYLTDTLSNNRVPVQIRYDDYWVRGIKVEGLRKLQQSDSTKTSMVLVDSVTNFTITDANRSTSELNALLLYEVFVEGDSILWYTTEGSGTGRNLTGRPFSLEINEAKHFSANCLQAGFQVAESGRESWTFERTANPNVIHTLNFQQAEDCNHTARIQLDDGQELQKKQ